MFNQKSTHITNYLNYFCDIKIKLKHKTVFSENRTLKWKSDFYQTCINIKTRYLKSFEAYCVWIEFNTHVV